jgi:hypothetical protein
MLDLLVLHPVSSCRVHDTVNQCLNVNGWSCRADSAVICRAALFFVTAGSSRRVDTEIDLMYPPDAKLFFTYLSKIVNDTIDWLSIAIATLIDSINYHKYEEIQEVSIIAGQTNFDLKSESNLNFSPNEAKDGLMKTLAELEKQGIDTKILDFLREKIINITSVSTTDAVTARDS